MKQELKQFKDFEFRKVLTQMIREPDKFKMSYSSVEIITLILNTDYLEKEDDLEYLLDMTNYYIKIHELLYNKHHRIEYLIIISGYLEQIINESIFYVTEVLLKI